MVSLYLEISSSWRVHILYGLLSDEREGVYVCVCVEWVQPLSSHTRRWTSTKTCVNRTAIPTLNKAASARCMQWPQNPLERNTTPCHEYVMSLLLGPAWARKQPLKLCFLCGSAIVRPITIVDRSFRLRGCVETRRSALQAINLRTISFRRIKAVNCIYWSGERFARKEKREIELSNFSTRKNSRLLQNDIHPFPISFLSASVFM